MSQPVALGQWTNIGTSGTVLVTDRSDAQLIRVVFPGTYVGTVIFHDAASTAGTTATSAIGTFGIPNTNVAGNVEIGIRCRYGLVYQATGTPVMTMVWD